MEQDKPNQNDARIPRGHEERDAAPRSVAIFVGVLIVALIAIHVIGWSVLAVITHRQIASDRIDHPEHPLARLMPPLPPGARLEPEPSHNVSPAEDLRAVRKREVAAIGDDAWAWVDASHRFARIPLKQATELAVERGLPATLPPLQPSALPGLPPASAVHGPGGLP